MTPPVHAKTVDALMKNFAYPERIRAVAITTATTLEPARFEREAAVTHWSVAESVASVSWRES